MKKLIFVIFVLLHSCNQEKENVKISHSYNKILRDCTEDVNELKLQNGRLLKRMNYEIVSNHISLEYIQYLDSIQKLCTSNLNPFFYEGDEIKTTKFGDEFIIRSSQFLEELTITINDTFLRRRAINLLSVEDFKYDEEWYISYLDYHFFNTNCEAFYYMIENRKRNVLLIQNEILTTFLLKDFEEKTIYNK